jgi:hypothetical protein
MFPSIPGQINSDTYLVREVLDGLILQQETDDMKSNKINSARLARLFNSGMLTLRLMPVLTWPIPNATLKNFNRNTAK